MHVVLNMNGHVAVALSESNLRTLLARVEAREVGTLWRATAEGALVVIGESDARHYAERPEAVENAARLVAAAEADAAEAKAPSCGPCYPEGYPYPFGPRPVCAGSCRAVAVEPEAPAGPVIPWHAWTDQELLAVQGIAVERDFPAEAAEVE